MKKEFVPYEPALKLKELGFDEPCFGNWQDMKEETPWFSKSYADNQNQYYGQLCSAPTFSQAFRFFREKYDWQHSIDPTADQHSHQLGYNYWIWNYKTGEEHYTMPKNRPTGDWEYKTYEEAELACLKKLIEIVKK